MYYVYLGIGIILLPITALVFFINVYNIVLSFMGFGKAKKDYPMIEDQTRFLILVAAHNEEEVIASTIENLRKIDYNKDLFDIVIANDNSTDRTGEICESLGIKHIDTIEGKFPREGVGKPGGIQYALRALGFEKLKEKYDLLMVLDADNHVDDFILKEVNSQYVAKNKPHAIQVYLDSKNTESTLSLGYATSYNYSNRFFQLSKYRIGLPNAIGGTGFSVRMDYLIDRGGFCYKSLTEDLEMEINIVKDGGTVLWNHFARIYDEKPDNLRISLRQRTRWSQGHWYVAFTNGMGLLKRFVKDGFRFKYIDQLVYLFGMAKIVQMLICILGIVFSSVGLLFADDYTYLNKFAGMIVRGVTGFSVISILIFVYSMFVLIPYALYKDSKQTKNLFIRILSMYYYGLTFLIAQTLGLLKWRQQHTWVKTEHKHKSIVGIKEDSASL